MNPHTPAQPVSFNNDGGRIAIQAAVYQNHGQTIVNQTSGGELERRLPHAVEAPFNAYARQHESFCLPDTRTALLEEIYDWADAQDKRGVYWLNGFAGTGKSTIARTLAHRLNGHGRLGGSFFFSKGGGDVGHAGKFVTSIAFQLAVNIPATRQHVCEAVTKFPSISSLSLQDQWRQLVLRPLSTLDDIGGTTSVVLVIDALDECDDEENIQKIIELLIETEDSRVKLRIFLTSRPELPIRHGFQYVSDALLQRCVLHHISPDIVDADIELFLREKLMAIGKQQCLHADWPGQEMIAKITQRASGLFIWAATAHRFIQGGRQFASQRLESIMKKDSDGPIEPERHLDNLYLTVLRASLSPEYTASEREEHCKMLRLVLGSLVLLHTPLSVQALGALLGVKEQGIESIVQDLHAILDIPEDENRSLRLHHPSLRDFLLDHSRCTDAEFYIDRAQAHGALALHCMELIIRFSQQGQELDEELLELEYALLRWDTHLQRSGNVLINNTRTRFFIEEYALKSGIRFGGLQLWKRRLPSHKHWLGFMVANAALRLASKIID